MKILSMLSLWSIFSLISKDVINKIEEINRLNTKNKKDIENDINIEKNLSIARERSRDRYTRNLIAKRDLNAINDEILSNIKILLVTINEKLSQIIEQCENAKTRVKTDKKVKERLDEIDKKLVDQMYYICKRFTNSLNH